MGVGTYPVHSNLHQLGHKQGGGYLPGSGHTRDNTVVP